MLDLGCYLLGVLEIALIVGFATLGGSALRVRLLPDFAGPPAHLATAVLALALLIWIAELLGTFGLLEPLPYVIGVGAVGLAISRGVGGGWGCPSRLLGFSSGESSAGRERLRDEKQDAAAPEGHPHPPSLTPEMADRGTQNATLIALAISAAAIVKFGLEVKVKLGTGMTGFDSTWYHGPFAAGFFQTGNTFDLHFIAPQFLAWFYPANSELFHSIGMLAFDRDLLSPLLNLGWFVGCLVACWCIGRPYGVAPWSLALGAVALSVPAFVDQAGEARNDVVGTFFLLAAAALALNARVRTYDRIPTISANSALLVGLAAGLAAGTKLNFLLPAAVLVLGLSLVVPVGARRRSLGAGALGALAGGGYWYLRNLVHSGNPLPWVQDLGPVSLPAPDQALGGREGHSVLGYLLDGAVWFDWLLPGLHDGLWAIWPLLLAAMFAGLVLPLARRTDPLLRIAALTGFATVLAWLVAPTSASGPEGMPRGFESGLRYLAPALILGLALLPAVPPLRDRLARSVWRRSLFVAHTETNSERTPMSSGRWALAATLVVLLAVAIGYPVQRHYLENRYADPTFTTPGLNAAFEWSRDISGARIAATSTRQYPLYGTDLSNHVQFIGEEQPHGGFTAPTTCRRWRQLLDEGDYDYVVASRDRIEPGKPPYPPTAAWTKGPGAKLVLRIPPAAVFQLERRIDPSACSR